MIPLNANLKQDNSEFYIIDTFKYMLIWTIHAISFVCYYFMLYFDTDKYLNSMLFICIGHVNICWISEMLTRLKMLVQLRYQNYPN